MKIQCDICNKRQASLFCTADEAVLCSTCDHRVHHANKLASKHRRFSLNHPNNSPNHFPLCDICLERRGCVFCQEDRAIVCKECDLKIHGVNEHTKKHNRFLLSGIKLYSPAPPPTLHEENGSFTISEYLINTIPDWKFEDFLESPSSVPSHELQQQNHIGKDTTLSTVHDDVNYHIHEENILVSFSSESMCGICVPQAPLYYSEKMDNKSDTINEATNFSSSLGDFTVPQITIPPN